jgi:hypothetical protein
MPVFRFPWLVHGVEAQFMSPSGETVKIENGLEARKQAFDQTIHFSLGPGLMP